MKKFQFDPRYHIDSPGARSTRKERQKMVFQNDFVFGPFGMKIIFDEK